MSGDVKETGEGGCCVSGDVTETGEGGCCVSGM